MSSVYPLGLSRPVSALIIGGKGGVGEAVANALLTHKSTVAVAVTSRDVLWARTDSGDARCSRHVLDITQAEPMAELAKSLKVKQPELNVIINCTGILHDDTIDPERSWRHLDMGTMQKVFAVNTFGVALAVRYLLPLLPRHERAIFASLSARVGSIGDNQLGGWYSYRASKAAQNMVIRTGAIEAKRSRPRLLCVTLHPGTVKTALSDPFTQRKPADQLFSSDQSSEYLIEVLGKLSAKDSGYHYAWDGERIPW